MNSLALILGNVGDVTAEIVAILTDATEKIDSMPGGGSSGARVFIANDVASKLATPASKLQIGAGEFERTVRRIEPGLAFLVERATEKPEELAQAPDFVSQMLGLIEAADGSVSSSLEFKETMISVGNATKLLRRSTKEIATAIQSIANTSSRIAGWRSILAPLVGESSSAS